MEARDRERRWMEGDKKEKKIINHCNSCNSLFEAVALPYTAREDADWFQTHNCTIVEPKKAYMGDKQDGQLKLIILRESINLSVHHHPSILVINP